MVSSATGGELGGMCLNSQLVAPHSECNISHSRFHLCHNLHLMCSLLISITYNWWIVFALNMCTGTKNVRFCLMLCYV